jgi:Ca2+-binding RTX toxin-like protein
MRATALALLFLVAVPTAANASTVGVEPYRERPDVDPFGSCGRYMSCPADMVVLTAPSGETNYVAITEAVVGLGQTRYLVRDERAPLVAGAGCERVEEPPRGLPGGAAFCTAGAVGPQQLGDGDDWLASPGGQAYGGDGDDVMALSARGANPQFSPYLNLVDGGEGDDVLIGEEGKGGPGDDVLRVPRGRGDAGDDILRCPTNLLCNVRGGPGNDVLFGGSAHNLLIGEGGRDFLHGRGGDDELAGGLGDDRLIGGAGPDVLGGGGGADTLEAREDRSAGEQPRKDRVDCGDGRRDRATVDRRDRVRRCEGVMRHRGRAR